MSTTKFPLPQMTLFSPAPNSQELPSREELSRDDFRGLKGTLIAIALCLPVWALVAWWVFA